MPPAPLTIGRLAKAAGVNVETIRYYQRVSLLTEPVKPYDGFRVYPDETINRIRFIKRAQKLGFSLKDIAHLLSLGDGHCDDAREQAEAKILDIYDAVEDERASGAPFSDIAAKLDLPYRVIPAIDA